MITIRKTFIAAVCITAVAAFTACGSSSSDKSDDGARAFAEKFASFVSNNQIDSIRALYPDAAECDSFALKFVADSIKIEANAQADTFVVNVGGGADFTVVKGADGTMKVTTSHGLLALNEADLPFAKSVGQYKEGLTDVKLARRMGVKDFKNIMISKVANEVRAKVIAGKSFREIKFPEYSADEGISAVTVTNGTSQKISGSDYMVKIFADGQYGSGYYNEKGRDIPAKGSVPIQFSYAGNSMPTKALVVLNLNDQQLFEKYFTPTGNEFDEYLKANNINLDGQTVEAEEQKPAANDVPSISATDDDEAAKQFIESFYKTYVLGDKDFIAVAKQYCTPKLLKKLLADNEYEDGGYAIWDFRSMHNDGNGPSKVKSISRVGEGLTYQVDMMDMGHPHKATVTLVKTPSGNFLFDNVK